MRKLESMIARFVEDLLQTIRDATVHDLEGLFGSGPIRVRTVDTAPPGGRRARPSAAPSASPSAPPRPSRLPRAGRESRGITREQSSRSRPPPTVAEITDPEALLSLATERAAESPSRPPRPRKSSRAAALVALPDPVQTELFGVPERVSELVAETESSPDLETPAPDSAVRPLGGPPAIRLSDNETVARVSNAGIVIRRRKKG